MATVVADPVPATADAPPAAGAPGAPPDPNGAGGAPSPATRTCANCGTPLSAGQDWCLQCGAGAPGNLPAGTPSWRSGASILIATAILVLAAAAAGYAALSKGNGRTVGVTRTVAQSVVPPATAPGVGGAAGGVPAIPKSFGTPTTVKPIAPLPAKPPKIPLTAITPKSPTTSTPSATTPSSTTPAPSTSGGSSESGPQPILLDTNAASTYNPDAHPAEGFGDPSLAIDGETATGWTAQVNPALAPRMADGLVLDLRSAHKLSALALVTTTPGITVQVLGAAGPAPPVSTTDPAWVKLSPPKTVKARHVRIKLSSAKAQRFVLVWISSAPAASVGTPQAPGRVSLNEVELFP